MDDELAWEFSAPFPVVRGAAVIAVIGSAMAAYSIGCLALMSLILLGMWGLALTTYLTPIRWMVLRREGWFLQTPFGEEALPTDIRFVHGDGADLVAEYGGRRHLIGDHHGNAEMVRAHAQIDRDDTRAWLAAIATQASIGDQSSELEPEPGATLDRQSWKLEPPSGHRHSQHEAWTVRVMLGLAPAVGLLCCALAAAVPSIRWELLALAPTIAAASAIAGTMGLMAVGSWLPDPRRGDRLLTLDSSTMHVHGRSLDRRIQLSGARTRVRWTSRYDACTLSVWDARSQQWIEVGAGPHKGIARLRELIDAMAVERGEGEEVPEGIRRLRGVREG